MIRRYPLILTLGAVLTLAFAPSRAHAEVTAGAAAHPCVGRWIGAGKNTFSSEEWSIDMVIEPPTGGRCGTIEYPSLRCGGHLERCEDKGAGRVVIKEHYTHNPGTCAPAGALDIVCAGDTMQWQWSGVERVRSTLRRVRPADAGAPAGGSTPAPPGSALGIPALPQGTPGNVPAVPPQGTPGNVPAPPAPPGPAEGRGGGGLCSAAVPVRAPGPGLGGVIVVAAALAARRRRAESEGSRPSGRLP